ncbi:NDR1 protein [Spatholobus suberectus]|nr:NDR1 protein [Spatholobus suberectus]
MAAASDSCCGRCFTFVVTIGLTALFLWLSLRVDEPRCYLESIYVPALNKSLNSGPNNTLFFVLRLVNNNKDKGIKYDDVSVSFGVFVVANATRALGNATVPRFYQGHEKKAHKGGSLLAAGNVTAAVDGRVVYRVDFATEVKYKILFWYTKRDRLWGGANVEINDSGTKAYRKPVRLGGNSPVVIESGAPKLRGRYRALVSFCVAAFLLGTGFS